MLLDILVRDSPAGPRSDDVAQRDPETLGRAPGDGSRAQLAVANTVIGGNRSRAVSALRGGRVDARRRQRDCARPALLKDVVRQDHERIADFDGIADLDLDARNDAVPRSHDVREGLVGLQLEQDLSFRNVRSTGDMNRGDDTLRDFKAQLGHYDGRDDDPSSK